MSVVDGGEVLKMPSPGSLKTMQDALTEPLPSVLPVKAPVAAVVDPGAVRVKLVISKQELKKMLDKEGMSLDDMVNRT
nr:unnamed protein product [Digitaria exilis]